MPVGVSADVIAAADIFAILPMHGMVDSLNVSVAAALMLNEARRGRHQVTFANRFPHELTHCCLTLLESQ